jgi:predicted RNA-binding Zn ribbon-like protein
MTAPEFPILGTEPIAVEFANTWYDAGRTDFLRTARLVDQWFAAMAAIAATANDTAAPARHTAAEAAAARVLRDHVHALLAAAAAGDTPEPAAVAGVNRCAAASPPALTLDWAPDGTRSARWAGPATGVAAALARIATNTVELLTTPGAGTLAWCTGPGCSMLFVRTHARRRFCHSSCGHRDRQARYYRRNRNGASR